MHSYSHKYDEIYASEEAFEEDLSRLQDFLYDTTGVWSHFYRFRWKLNQVSTVDMRGACSVYAATGYLLSGLECVKR